MSTATTVAPLIFAYCRARWPEAADAEDRHQLTGAGAGDLDRLVGGHAGAGQRRGVQRVDPVGDLGDVGGVRGGVLGVGAVPAVAGVDLLLAQGLPAVDAELADPAGRAEPGHGDPVADLRRDDHVHDVAEPVRAAGPVRRSRFRNKTATAVIQALPLRAATRAGGAKSI